MSLRERLVRLLRRLFRRRKRRWYEIDMTRLRRELLVSLCADGDYAVTVGRPEVKVREVTL